jgi:molybdate transport system permease protein
MSADFLAALALTLRLAGVTTLLLVVAGLPLAHWLNRFHGWPGIGLEAVLGLPLVLPPTVLGYYLLVAFAPNQILGTVWHQLFRSSLAFSFPGLVLGSFIYSLPFAVQPFQTALRGVSRSILEAGAMEANRRQVFVFIHLPLAWRGILLGATLAFAHTIGEFGVVLMIGGNIPGKTRTASIALFDEVQKLNYSEANQYAIALLLVATALLACSVALSRRTG